MSILKKSSLPWPSKETNTSLKPKRWNWIRWARRLTYKRAFGRVKAKCQRTQSKEMMWWLEAQKHSLVGKCVQSLMISMWLTRRISIIAQKHSAASPWVAGILTNKSCEWKMRKSQTNLLTMMTRLQITRAICLCNMALSWLENQEILCLNQKIQCRQLLTWIECQPLKDPSKGNEKSQLRNLEWSLCRAQAVALEAKSVWYSDLIWLLLNLKY